MEQATGQLFSARYTELSRELRDRWSDPIGMTLLHGDINGTNVLTPKNADSPVYFLDRQPFEWSLTYGLGVDDLAYFLLFWSTEDRKGHDQAILRCWFEAFAQPNYSWKQAQTDWRLSVKHTLHVPLEWCSKPETISKMRWLWERQLHRVQEALA